MRALVCLLALLLLLRCSTLPRHYVDRAALEEIEKVAVLPFQNLTDDPIAGEVTTRIFHAELIRSGLFAVEELGNIEDFMFQQRIRRRAELDRRHLLLLRRRLETEAVIMGTVSRFEYVGEVPRVALAVRMVTTEEGRIVWKARIERDGEDYLLVLNLGRIRSLQQLCRAVARELIRTMRR